LRRLFYSTLVLQAPLLHILGCGSATPTPYRNPTAQVLQFEQFSVLIDCGEGTQMQLLKYKVKSSRIHSIFISHLHGDHYLGLPGLISSMHLLGRKHALHLYAPEALFELLELQFRRSDTHLKFPLHMHAVDCFDKQKIAEIDGFEVYTFPLKHGIPCFGYQFVQKPKPGNINMEMIERYNIPVSAFKKIKLGADFTLPSGTVISNSLLVKPHSAALSYAYCSDTAPCEQVTKSIAGSNWLYHEATFLHDLKHRAVETFHSTAFEAATVAKNAGVKHLIIGHFSSRYRETALLEAEANAVFPQTIAAHDGLQLTLTLDQ
jgi:ribonuclease Z